MDSARVQDFRIRFYGEFWGLNEFEKF
jgi:hypothetical protein